MTRKKRLDARKVITEKIIEALKAGVAPWVKGWDGGSSDAWPTNGSSGRRYSGVNVLMLMLERTFKGYTSNEWMTFKQAKALSTEENPVSVRKGEKGTQIVFTKFIERRDENDEVISRFPILKLFSVFNRDQIDGLPEQEEQEPLPEVERHARADQVIESYHKAEVPISYGGDKAAYYPSRDAITVPAIEAFTDPERFYQTTLHEIAHSTGHKSRLDRDLTGRFGTPSYAKEELVAEITSAFLCAELQIEGKLQHEGYIASWIQVLENDHNLIFKAARLASKAADYVLQYEEGASEAEIAEAA